MSEIVEKDIIIREIGKEISNKFSFGEIYRALKGINNEPKILSFIFENYKGFLNDIDYIIVAAYKLSKEKNKKGNIKERK